MAAATSDVPRRSSPRLISPYTCHTHPYAGGVKPSSLALLWRCMGFFPPPSFPPGCLISSGARRSLCCWGCREVEGGGRCLNGKYWSLYIPMQTETPLEWSGVLKGERVYVSPSSPLPNVAWRLCRLCLIRTSTLRIRRGRESHCLSCRDEPRRI